MTSINWEIAKEKFNTCKHRTESPVTRVWQKPDCGVCPPKPYTSFHCMKLDIFPFTNYACCENCKEYQAR